MKTMHVWMPDGRSLCDRRAQVPTGDVATLSESEFDQLLAGQTNAPACGSCLLLAEYLHADAAVIYKVCGERVDPVKPSEAWGALQDTRWARVIDVCTFVAENDLDSQLMYERLPQGISAERLEGWVTLRAAETEKLRDRLIRQCSRVDGPAE
jgi:hypothetical protein